MAVTTASFHEPAGEWRVRSALAELRRATEFTVPERVLSFQEYREQRRGKFSPHAPNAMRVRPTEVPKEWTGPDEPQPLMPPKHMSKFAGRMWHWALNRACAFGSMFDLEQQVAHLKQRQRALLATISFHEENDAYMENLSTQLDKDFADSFGKLRPRSRREMM